MGGNPKLAEYNYTLRADGKKESADEIIYATDGTTPVSHTQFDWMYDNASRLTDEVFTDVGNLMADVDNYHAAFEYDLTGNRLTQTTITDTNHDGIFNAVVDRDEVTTYTSDANDRMLSESTVVDGAATEATAYGYTGTQQTSKTVSPASGSPLSAVSFTYDLQGRMFRATTETFNAGTLTSRNRATYQYGTDGIRFSARSETDTVLNLTTANWQLTTDTKYLIDAHNHTGYQQVLQETVTDANGNLIKKIVYTIGLDHISQTTFTPGGPAQGTTAVFHMDGHGSTRILTDLAGAILNIAGFAQIYHYTAYGEAINFQMANAATQYLYSGEQFDARIGQQYLRARYYNQANGTFNRLDPFFGNQTDPPSFHKYLYTHGDPVNGWDPTGNEATLVGSLGGSSIGAHLNGITGEAGNNVLQMIKDKGEFDWKAFAITASFASFGLASVIVGRAGKAIASTADLAVYLKQAKDRLVSLTKLKHGKWSNTIGSSVYTPLDAAFQAASGGKGVQFRGNFPDFGEWVPSFSPHGGGPPRKVEFDIEIIPGVPGFSTTPGPESSRVSADFRAANERFAREFLGEVHTSGADIGKGIQRRAEEFLNGRHAMNSTGTIYTWHHHENMSTMQLVPTDIHRPVAHTGGRGLLDFLLGL